MNEEQKKRAAELLTAWRATAYALHGDAMADLLQELVGAPETEPVLVVETEPGYWNRGHYHEGTKSYIDPTKVWGLPVGTKLYTAPPAPSVPETEPVAWNVEGKDGETMCVTDNKFAADRYIACGYVVEPLYTAPPAPSVPDGWRPAIAKEFPLFDEDGLDEDKHCCEWVMLQERKRLHKMLAAPTPAEPPADVAQDAERYRAIRGGIVDIRDCGNTVAVEYKSVVRYCRSDEDFDQEIDAAIAAEKGQS